MIYALIHPSENWVYVGKTASPRLSATYSRHICGKVSATDGYFTAFEDRPLLYLLETLFLTASEAYKHVLAWIHYLESEGYCSINHDRTTAQSESLKPDTLEILQCIRREPLSEILERTRVLKPTDADRSPDSPFIPGLPTVQLNMRVNPHDKQLFTDFCTRQKVNQREAFSLLLDRLSPDGGTPHTDELIKSLREKNQALEQANQRLQKRLSVATGVALPDSVQKDLSLLTQIREGISQYVHLLNASHETGEPVVQTSYRRFVKSLPPNVSYPYPAEEGSLTLTVDAVLWGGSLHKARFLVGHDENNRYRLRYYPKKNFFGIHLDEKGFFIKGSRWFLLFQRAKDGAMDIAMALPIIPHDTNIVEAVNKTSNISATTGTIKLSLDKHFSTLYIIFSKS